MAVLKIRDWLSAEEAQFAIVNSNFFALRFKDYEVFKVGECIEYNHLPYDIFKFCEDNIHLILLFYDTSELKVEIDEISSLKHLFLTNETFLK